MVEIKNERYIALAALNNIINNNMKMNVVLESVRNNPQTNNLSNYVEKVVKGVIENLDNIDKIIYEFSKTKKIKPIILNILRLSIYEMKYMDTIPSYATINEAGNLVKKYKLNGLLPYVNGVLRNISRSNYVLNGDVWENKNTLTKNVYVRINDILNTNSIVENLRKNNIELVEYKGGLIFNKYKVFSCICIKQLINTSEFKNGKISIQDASSIYLCEKIFEYINKLFYKKNNESIHILDLCASPGGKSMGLYHLLKNTPLHTYWTLCDKTNSKTQIINENAIREKLTNYEIKISDATIKKTTKEYDVIIADVPCSGLGVLNKKPDINLHTSKEKIENLQIIQRKIIDANILSIKKGGLFSYSTCTITKEENVDNKNYILTNYKNMKLLYEKQINILDENNCDGFYICLFTKE